MAGKGHPPDRYEDSDNFPLNSPQPKDELPEKKLLASILERAIQDAAGSFNLTGSETSYEQREALDWLHISRPLRVEDVYAPEVLSFCWVCYHLDMDPAVLRRAIAASLSAMKTDPEVRRRFKTFNRVG